MFVGTFAIDRLHVIGLLGLIFTVICCQFYGLVCIALSVALSGVPPNASFSLTNVLNHTSFFV